MLANGNEGLFVLFFFCFFFLHGRMTIHCCCFLCMMMKDHVVLHDSLKHMLGTFGTAYFLFFFFLPPLVNGIYIV